VAPSPLKQLVASQANKSHRNVSFLLPANLLPNSPSALCRDNSNRRLDGQRHHYTSHPLQGTSASRPHPRSQSIHYLATPHCGVNFSSLNSVPRLLLPRGVEAHRILLLSTLDPRIGVVGSPSPLNKLCHHHTPQYMVIKYSIPYHHGVLARSGVSKMFGFPLLITSPELPVLDKADGNGRKSKSKSQPNSNDFSLLPIETIPPRYPTCIILMTLKTLSWQMTLMTHRDGLASPPYFIMF